MSTRVAIDVVVQKPETPAIAPYAERLRALGVNVVGYGLRAGMETLLHRVYDAVVGLLQSHSDRANLSRAGQQFAKRVCTISAAEPALDRLIAASAQRGPKRPMVLRYFAMSALVAQFILKRAVSRTAH